MATLDALGPALTRCFQAPEHTDGFSITIRFSLGRRGAMIGRPMVTYSDLPGAVRERQDFVAAAFRALDACTPVPVTAGLGAAIAGRPLSVRFLGGSLRRTIERLPHPMRAICSGAAMVPDRTQPS